MKKYFMVLTGYLLLVMTAGAQQLAGTWMGNLDLTGGMQLPLVLHIQQKGTGLAATLDSPAQGAKGIVVDSISFKEDSLRVTINQIGMRYTGGLVTADSMTGIFSQMGARLSLSLARSRDSVFRYNRPQQPRPPFNYRVEEISLTNAVQSVTLAGTLTTPSDKKDFPVVVLITGSGAQDRNETLFGHEPFWVIADYFARHGIGALRLDDRGIGGSSGDFSTATSADFAMDINAAVEWLSAKGYENIGLVGHSEGGMIAPMVAAANPKLRFIILLAGPGVRGAELLETQMAALNRAAGMSEDAVAVSVAQTKKRNALILQYQDADLENKLRTTLQQQLHIDSADDSRLDQQIKVLTSPWYQYFIRFNPQDYLSKLQLPVLALNGSLDLQVTADENLAGIRSSLERAGNKHFETRKLEGLNHLFQQAKTGTIAEYASLDQSFAPEVLELMRQWILGLANKQP
ncbi:alpha/beta fold hydrolase [Niabella terrae]